MKPFVIVGALMLAAGAFLLAALAAFAFWDAATLAGILLVFATLVVLAVVGYLLLRLRAGSSPTWLRRDTVLIASTALVTVLLVLGAGYASMFMTRASNKDLAYTSRLEAVCEKRYFPDAPAFGSTTPITVVAFARNGQGRLRELSGSEFTSEGNQVQAVVCLTESSAGGQVGECEFEEGRAPLYQGRYRGTVIEAKTGHRRGEVQVDGVTTNEHECPMMAWYTGNLSDVKFLTEPSADAVMAAIAPTLR